ncbi:O-antigen polymerase [Flavilitoribacter nigricans DSM 23189 = NBRC 102662]|uniref:O-antigen polymerase n=1 Tax=Flavilitoribacter nigricans (strain ATCC 23147 / DSM 23189 / NBRC 102662 / NCIMB 1420 / SS-2) TaxID=1122177 RepID=A0A2D0N5P7_FLAN2|nr:O-antigen polymerase [Flavilitoribacter nigricans DSM 23189 = NBRC 102662]
MLTYLQVPDEASGNLFLGLGILVLVCLGVGIATGWYFLAGLPAFFLLIYLTFVDFRAVFFLLLACLPLSTEIQLPNGFGTDLPTEPLMIGLMLVYGLYVIQHGRQMDSRFVRHPISLLLILHVAWVLITTITSELLLVSVKFSLAKIWYVTVFYFLAGGILRKQRDVRTYFWVIFIPLMFTVLVTLVRHSTYNFSFRDVHRVLHPFQRNHVNYAATMALFFPVVWLAVAWYRRWSLRWWILVGSIAVLVLAIYLSYTRAAYIAVMMAFGAYLIIRLRLMKVVLAGGLLVAVIGVGYMVQDNTYLDYAPNYDRTVSHYQFDNLLEATAKGEDISTMERVYRWVAGFHMFRDKPAFGYGPGNFVNFYRPYTVTSFTTYVSDNKEQSGIHSYYLLVLVEQGVLGLILFLTLSFYVLIRGEEIYHRARDAGRRRIVLMVLLSTVVIDAFLIINDLVETDKVGAFFFLAMAILVNQDLENGKAD